MKKIQSRKLWGSIVCTLIIWVVYLLTIPGVENGAVVALYTAAIGFQALLFAAYVGGNVWEKWVATKNHGKIPGETYETPPASKFFNG